VVALGRQQAWSLLDGAAMPKTKTVAPVSHLNQAGFDEVIASCDPAIAAIARAARRLVIDVLPEVHEIVWLRQRNIGYGVGPKKQSEHFCWISPASKHVTFGFNCGVKLPDPKKLLEGTGDAFRHVKLASLAHLDRPGLRALVVAAVKQRAAEVGG
jgi:hypothetical protein